MWKAVLFFTCFEGYVTFSATAVDEYVHPHYTYSCAENRSIIIRGISNGGIVWINLIKNKTSGCPDDEINVTNQQALIERNCINHIDNRSEVTVRIWDKLHDGKHKPPFPRSLANITGGREIHHFKLICNDIPKSGVDRTSERQMHLTDTEEKTDQIFKVGNVKMTFRTTSDINSEELNSVYIGDEFYMFLNYNGDSNYVLMPVSCTALKGYNVDYFRYKNAVNGSEKVLLWDNNKCLSKVSISYSIMEDFSFTDNFARAKMYGFHFPKSQHISIICEVTVCKSLEDPGCSIPQGNGCPNATISHDRKKRNSKSVKDDELFYVSNQRNLILPRKQRNDKDHSCLVRRSTKMKISKNDNFKVYKTIRVLDPDKSGAKRHNVLSLFLLVMGIVLVLII